MTSIADLPVQLENEQPAEQDTTLPAAEHTAPESADIAPDSPEEQPDPLSEEDPQVQRARWEAEYDTILHVDPHEVILDENIRTENTGINPDLVRDLRARGVDTPLQGYRTGDGTVALEGMSRAPDSAFAALATLPAADA